MCEACEEKDEEIRQLKAELYNHGWEPPEEIGLSPTQTRIVRCLVTRTRWATSIFLFEASRGTRAWADEPSLNLISAHVSHIRNKFKPFGLSIESNAAGGWRITPESRARLLNWKTQARAA